MKALVQTLLFLAIIGLAINTVAEANEYAVVICKVNDRGHLLVATADLDTSCGMSGIGQKSRPCVQVLNEVSSKGYKLTNVESQETQTQIPILYVVDKEEIKKAKEMEDFVLKIEIERKHELVFILEKI